jgi:hypothetical protein
MRIYTVHEKPGRADDGGPDVICVKEGFCWPAFFFPLVWLIYRRLWAGLALYVAFMFVLVALTARLGEPAVNAVLFGLGLWVAFEANDWRRRKLARRGYREQTALVAPSNFAAEERYLIARLGPSVKGAEAYCGAGA